MARTIYEIKINNWEKHNSKIKAGHTHFMLSKRLFDDPIINELTPTQLVIYVRLLSIRADSMSDQCKVSVALMPTGLRLSDHSMRTALETLQSFQLLTYEKHALNRIEIKRKEENRIERKGIESFEKNDSCEQSSPATKKSEHFLIKIWNENCGELAKVKKSNPQRDKLIKSRWGLYTEQEWTQVVKNLAASDFCCGKNDRGWRADFNFLLKPETPLKVLEGKYDNRQSFTYGKTDDGRFLTNAVKRSHNNKLMIEKYLTAEPKDDENEIKNAGSDLLDC